uniref:hypothetical protein n=1 Tax=Corynebacterium sp. SA-MJD20WY100 TaxID=3142969 RepID=UPI003221F255
NGCAYCLNPHTKVALMLAEAAAQPSDAPAPAPPAQPDPLPASALLNARLKLRGSTKEQT